MAVSWAEETLQGLFGENVAICALEEAIVPGRLDPVEARAVERATGKRRDEFARGRTCAKAAIRKLTDDDSVVPHADDRTPVWPDGLVGSIAHCEGLCCAVAGAKTNWAGLGVDVENIQAIPDDRLALILTEPERAACHDRTIDPLTVFCAKEAFYKCYFPLFGSFLTFQDVYVVIQQRTPNVGTFRATLLNSAKPGADGARRIKGAWSKRHAFLFAAATLERA